MQKLLPTKKYCWVGETLIFEYTLLKNYDLLAFYSWSRAKSTLSTVLGKSLKTCL